MAGFVLHDGANALRELPASFWPPDELGGPDPFTWERSPESPVWFISGDGLPREHPTFQLVGETVHRTPAMAFAEIAGIQADLAKSRALYYDGARLANLDPTIPGTYHPRFDRVARKVSHRLQFNTTAAVTPANFAGLAAPPPPSGTGGGTSSATDGGYYTTTTVYVEGVPVEMTVWRVNA